MEQGKDEIMQQSPSLSRQLLASLTIYTLSMSIGAGSGFSGVVIPQVLYSPHIYHVAFHALLIVEK